MNSDREQVYRELLLERVQAIRNGVRCSMETFELELLLKAPAAGELVHRLAEKELRPAKLVQWQLVGTNSFWDDMLLPVNRASIRGVIFFGKIEGEPKKGKMVDFWDLPKINMVKSHLRLIPIGLQPLFASPTRFS